MGKRASIYISDYDSQRLLASGLSLIDVLRAGFDAIEHQPAKVTPRTLARPTPALLPPCPHPRSRVHKGMCGACGQGGL
jgi:hypothetical protein